jgi:hypothetical protein
MAATPATVSGRMTPMAGRRSTVATHTAAAPTPAMIQPSRAAKPGVIEIGGRSWRARVTDWLIALLRWVSVSMPPVAIASASPMANSPAMTPSRLASGLRARCRA